MKKKKSGTREWSERSANCRFGCAHGCIYCYGRAARFNGKRGEDWAREEIKAVSARSLRRAPGVVMFPTLHDVTPENMHVVLPMLWKLLAAGNEVLWVSKPHQVVVATVVERLKREVQWWSKISMRFTIGSTDSGTLKLWEPGAPCFEERLMCLALAARSGLPTSASCEPLLVPSSAAYLVTKLAPHVTDDRPEGGIWIGKLNHARARCAWYLKAHPEFAMWLKALEEWQTDEAVEDVYRELTELPPGVARKLRWKDSYREALARRGVSL